MTFVDTNVFMYAVGRPHPLQDAARTFSWKPPETGGRFARLQRSCKN